MNDRFLYRAKRKDNGEWIEGNLVWSDDTDDDYKAIIIPTTGSDMFTRGGASGDLGFEKWYMVDPSTICQCTGYKGIWENDIFQFDGERYMIVFSDASLTWNAESIFSSEILELGEFCYSEIDVIGNVFDNPELMEVGK